VKSGGEKPYRLVAGFRRTLACKILKHETIRATVHPGFKDEGEALAFNLAENVNRTETTIQHEATVIHRLQKLGYTRKDLEKALKMSWPWIKQRIDYNSLPMEVQEEILAGSLPKSKIGELSLLYRQGGIEALAKALTKVRGDLEKGVAGSQIKIRPDKNKSRRVRNSSELFDLQQYLHNLFGKHTLVTRVLGWAAGAVDNESLHEMIREEAEFLGIPYKKPGNLKDSVI
jgi:ParB/RepB/Spo0J family partition protein